MKTDTSTKESSCKHCEEHGRDHGGETPSHHEPHATAQSDESLYPLLLIVSYILGGVVLRSYLSGDFSPHTLMANFMGGFFVVFSLFKLLNLSGFADGYSTYDLLAMRSRSWALSYPFIELLLGIAYFVGAAPNLVNTTTASLMGIGSIGVYRALRRGDKIQCACLGTVLKLPMTKVTLVEDLLMGVMAVIMLCL